MKKTAVSLALSGMAIALSSLAGPAHAQVAVFGGETERMSVRMAYFDQATQSSPGQFIISWGAPVWKDDYNEQVDALKGQRLRVGSNDWATLDTNVELTVGGQSVSPGQYYLALDGTDEGGWNLVLLDADEIRSKKLDAFQAGQTTGGIIIPMKYEKADEKAEKLSIRLHKSEVNVKRATLELAWGPHQISARIDVGIKS